MTSVTSLVLSCRPTRLRPDATPFGFGSPMCPRGGRPHGRSISWSSRPGHTAKADEWKTNGRMAVTSFRQEWGLGVMKIYRLLFGSLLASLALLCGQAQAQGPAESPPNKQYTQQRHFILPIELDEADRARINEVQLYVKTNPGEPWVCKQTVLATQSGFDLHAPQDGEYWFATATIDKAGKLNPVDTSRMPAVMTVAVDSTPPDLTMRALPPSGKGMLVEFKIKDANPDPNRLKVEMQGMDKSWQVLQPLPDNPLVFRLPGPAV